MNYIKTMFDLWQLKRNEKKTAEEISSYTPLFNFSTIIKVF